MACLHVPYQTALVNSKDLNLKSRTAAAENVTLPCIFTIAKPWMVLWDVYYTKPVALDNTSSPLHDLRYEEQNGEPGKQTKSVMNFIAKQVHNFLTKHTKS